MKRRSTIFKFGDVFGDAMQCNAGYNKARVSLISTYLDLTVKVYAIKDDMQLK